MAFNVTGRRQVPPEGLTFHTQTL